MRLTHQNLCYFVAFGLSKKKAQTPNDNKMMVLLRFAPG